MAVYSVTQFNTYVKNIFRMEELLRNISVRGEVGDWSYNGGTAYFVLKDGDAQVNCVCFDAHEQEYLPTTGEKVVVVGSPSYYVKSGRLNFHVNSIEPMGEGELYKQFLLLKNRLLKEGLFDRKRPIPSVIRRIGVVTSPTGAVIRDIINVVKRRSPQVDVVVMPVKVQGIGAENEIDSAIKFLGEYDLIDAVVVARGGGALEDLGAFNTEMVARAVAQCPKFVVSAVGHETDYTLCDFAADLRAPTPSAAAELLTQDMAAQSKALVNNVGYLHTLMQSKYRTAREHFRMSLLEMENRIITITQKASAQVLQLQSALDVSKFLIGKESQAVRMSDMLESLNPLRLTEQGYARVTVEGKNVESATQVNLGDKIKVYLKDGSVGATVNSKE